MTAVDAVHRVALLLIDSEAEAQQLDSMLGMTQRMLDVANESLTREQGISAALSKSLDGKMAELKRAQEISHNEFAGAVDFSERIAELEAELRRRSKWHHRNCRKQIYDIGSSPCTCETEVAAELKAAREQIAALESKEVCNCPHDDSVLEGCPYCRIEAYEREWRPRLSRITIKDYWGGEPSAFELADVANEALAAIPEPPETAQEKPE